MSYRTDHQRVAGLGSAKHGTEHFWMQRVTAIALAILTPFFVFTFAANIGHDHGVIAASFGSPFTAIISALFVITMFYHLALGLQVVIEDYIHNKGWRTSLLVLNSLLCLLLGFTGLFAIAKLAFTV